MDDDRAGTRTTIGYSLGLVGAVGFAVGAFLPFYSFGPGNEVLQRSLYQDFTGGASSAGAVGAWLLLFGGVVIIAVLSFVGLPASSPRPRPVAYVTAAVTWAVTWVGLLLVGSDGYGLKVGFWSMLLSVGVVIVGAIVIASTLRHPHTVEQAPDTVAP